jgi:thiol-disulfide isomerase/thioredoxin
MNWKIRDLMITAGAVSALTIVGCGNSGDRAAQASGEKAAPAAAGAVRTTGAIGEQAFDFTLKNLEGRDVRLSDFRGKIVILDFWATWCGPCKMEIPHFKELYKEYRARGLEIVGIALDNQGARVVAPFVKQNAVEYVTLIGNQDAVSRYGNFTGIPTTFIIDPQGKIVNKFVGYRSKTDFEVEITKLLGSKG